MPLHALCCFLGKPSSKTDMLTPTLAQPTAAWEGRKEGRKAVRPVGKYMLLKYRNNSERGHLSSHEGRLKGEEITFSTAVRRMGKYLPTKVLLVTCT